ncbi:alpha/beta hydrolase [Cupriavidus metallidurans]|nr:alpha/beta hydrolase [Cupriavidus metallidurans]QGS32675.1 alpha/beta fold hydrolase [Cupriavidus metallidurans]
MNGSAMPVASAFPGLSSSQASAMLALGPRWTDDIQANRRQVCTIYDSVHAAQPADGIRSHANIAYGTHARQRLDLYLPEGSAAGDDRPVVVFVHGGAFIRGDKDASPHIYANVPRWCARQGYIGVNVEYRLAPEASYPAGAEDVAMALAWLRAHARAHGGDPGRIVLIGHSAGGSHVASCLSDPACGENGSGVAGAVLVSARLQADTLPDNPNANGVAAYYGSDPALQLAHAPMPFAGRLRVPLMVAFAEFENPYLDLYALQYAARVREAQGRSPRVVQVARHNHTSIVAHLGTADTTLSQTLSEFLETVTRITT